LYSDYITLNMPSGNREGFEV